MNLEEKLINGFLLNHSEEAAQVLNGMNGSDIAELLQISSTEAAARGIRHVLPKIAADALINLNSDVAAKIIKDLPMDAQLVLLHRLDITHRDSLLAKLKVSHARTLRQLLDYPEGSAGKLMDPAPVAVLSTDTVEEAMAHVRVEAESIRYYIYVVDKSRLLVGVVTLRQLLQENRRHTVASIMESNVVSLSDIASERDIISHPRWKDFHSLPVVDSDGVLIGLIRYETLGRLKEIFSKDTHEQNILGTLLALGELYWLGMTGSLDTMATKPNSSDTQVNHDGDSNDL